MIDRESVLCSLGEVEGLWFKGTGHFEDIDAIVKDKNIILLAEDITKHEDNSKISYMDITYHNDIGYDVYRFTDFSDTIESTAEGYQLNIYDFFSKVWYEIEYSCESTPHKESYNISKESLERMNIIKDKVGLLLEYMEENGIDSILFDDEGQMTNIKRWCLDKVMTSGGD